MVIGIVMVGFFINLRLRDFTSFDVTTSYRKVNYVNDSAVFPNIAICNKNKFFWSYDVLLNKFEMERNNILFVFGISYSKTYTLKGQVILEVGVREEGNVERERTGREKRQGGLRPFYDFMMSTGIIPGLDEKTGYVIEYTEIDEQY